MTAIPDERREARALHIVTIEGNLRHRERLTGLVGELVEHLRSSPLTPAAHDAAEQLVREMAVADQRVRDGLRLLKAIDAEAADAG